MKFKASLQDRGAKILEKAFLPTLEKFGKTFQLLLGPEDVHLVQTTVNTDGPHVAARVSVGVLFDESTFRIQSRHYNLIAVSVDVGLMLKVLRSASTSDADALEVKLVQRAMAAPGEAQPLNKPFLSFTCRGASISLVQDLPVSRPFAPADIDRLVRARDVADLCPFYVDLARAGARLHATVERMRGLGSVVRLATCKSGDLHLQVVGSSVLMGTQLQGLPVFPQNITANPDVIDRQQTAEQQLADALEVGEGAAVHLQLKQLAKVISVAHLSQPSQILCGIAEGNGHVHVMYVYKDPTGDQAYDDTIGLSFKLPVRDDD